VLVREQGGIWRSHSLVAELFWKPSKSLLESNLAPSLSRDKRDDEQCDSWSGFGGSGAGGAESGFSGRDDR
jgi:hypothetical protein